ncbi:P-loop containing nucleoside triphosphate hydrolase protein [Elaphomyces granulatus]
MSNPSGLEFQRILALPASQSLRASAALGALHTGLDPLDGALASPTHELSRQNPRPRGIPRAQITEIYGPPGVGKTTIAISTAVNALHDGDKVVWIDTSSPIPAPRVRELLHGLTRSTDDKTASSSRAQEVVEDDHMKRFIHLSARSLPHLLALLLHPPTGFPPEGTSLLVLDSISAPFLSYFPHTTELKSKFDQKLNDNQQLQWLLNRRRNVLNELISHLLKVAASRRLAVLLLNQTHTKVKGHARPTLYPALAGGPWEMSVHTRILLYRDWLPTGPQAIGNDRVVNSPRIAEVTRKGGKALPDRAEENIVLFFIETVSVKVALFPFSPPFYFFLLRREDTLTKPDQNKLREMKTEGTLTNLLRVNGQPAPEKWRKRKAAEIADSQDELGEDSEADDDWIKGIEAGLLADKEEREDS